MTGPKGPRIGPRPPRVFDEGPRGPTITPRADPQSPRIERVPQPVVRPIEDSPEERRHKQQHEAALLGEGRIGQDGVTAAELASMGTLVAARHLMVLLAKRRADRSRALAEAGDLLIALEKGALVRRLLLELPDAGRIVDIYPLEVLTYVLERRPDLLEGFEVAEFVQNKRELERRVFAVEEVIPIKVPLSLKMRAFALEGGGTPGYCLAPGPPGAYQLELGEAGEFRLLLRGDVRKKSLVDRVVLRVEEPPEAGR